MRIRLFCFMVIYGCFFFLFREQEAYAQKNYQVDILQSDASGVTLKVSLPSVTVGRTLMGGKEYAFFDFGGTLSVYGMPGDPTVPVMSIALLAPPKATVRARLVGLETETFDAIRLLPIPTYRRNHEEIPEEYDYAEGAPYQMPQAYPAENIFVHTGYFRDWHTVRVGVIPVVWYPMRQQAQVWKQVIIRVDFSGENKGNERMFSPKEEDAQMEAMFLNYAQGRKWKMNIPVFSKTGTQKNLLASGVWYKIKITEEGVYKLDKKFFSSIGVKIHTLNPKTIKIYNNGGQALPILPESLSFADPNNPLGIQALSLMENAILVIGEEDQRFDDKDYVLFYARGTKKWLYDSTANQYKFGSNYYTEENVYWLTFNDGVEGKRMPLAPMQVGAGILQTHFLHRYRYEKDEENIYQSGLTWVHKPLANGQSAVYPEAGLIPSGGLLNQADLTRPVQYRVKFKGAVYNGLHRFTVSIDGQHTTSTGDFTQFTGKEILLQANPANLSTGRVQVVYSSSRSGSMGALDWFEMEYYRKLRLHQNTLLVYSPLQAGLYRYAVELQGTSASDLKILDITDFANVRIIPSLGVSGDTLYFQDSVRIKQPKQYLIVRSQAYRTISSSQVAKDFNSDLQNPNHSADYLIITHRLFKSEAERLAMHRRQFNGFRVMVVDIEDVFDEFGAGLPDPVAIRDFLRYAYYRWQTPAHHDRLMYVLLMGDGDYDYRNLIVKKNHNWIPTYQIQSDFVVAEYPINSRQVDDAFTYLNDMTVAIDLSDTYESFPFLLNPFPDLAIGRIPCNDEEEARAVVDKTIQFELTPATEPWKNTFTFVADDEYAGASCESLNLHMGPTDDTFSDTLIVPGYIRKEKIYLSNYPVEMIGSTRIRRYAREHLLQMINQGSMIINYVGHGNPKQLAHERVYVDETDFPLIRNAGRYFYFTNFSCSFARFDALDRKGGGERLVISPHRGAVGLFAATRVVFAGHHTDLMDRVFRRLYQTGKIGLANLQAKVLISGQQVNNEKYNLLGDPALTIPYARRSVVFSSVQPSVVRALDKLRIEGYVTNGSGLPDAAFNGEVLITLTDRRSQKWIRSLCLPGDQKMVLYDGAFLYRGTVKAEQGQFALEFIVPRDISYSGEAGKISAFAANGEVFAGKVLQNIIIDSLSQTSTDTTGPQITIGFHGQQFANGDPVPENPVLNVYMNDSSGINITNSSGHQIQLIVNNRIQYNLTPYYRPDRDDFRKGSLQILLEGLTPGSYEAVLTAFDNANNVSRKNFQFQVVRTGEGTLLSEKISLKNVMNFPNPFKKETHFTFFTNHPASDVEIRIFTVAGRMIRKIETTASFGYNSIRWDGRDDDGHRLANGIYLYKIKVRSQTDGSGDQYTGKMMIAK